MADLAYAQDIIIDPSGNVGFKPSVQRNTRAPVVDIAKPNSGGVSRNKYKRLNVQKKGVVLNNSATGTNTQVAGQIAGNKNLANGTASVIVNEVTSTAKSSLNGAIEVAGDRAGVIVANPNGINCDGCFFVNAGEGTLTTGRPVINGSNVALDVTSGTVTVGRRGLNGSAGSAGAVNNINLIARTVVIDGKVTAIEGINVQGGAQRYDLTNKRSVRKLAGAGAKPDFVVDGRQYGAMEAGRIQIIGNEAGLGVRTLGAVQTTTGSATISGQGKTTVRSVQAAGRATVRTTGVLEIQRDITSATEEVRIFGAAAVNMGVRAGLFGRTGISVSGGTLTFDGTLQSTDDIDLAANKSLAFGAYGASGAAFSFSAKTGLSIQDATIVAQTLTANSGTSDFRLDDSAIFLGRSLEITSGNFYFGRDVVIDGLSADQDPTGTVTASGDITNDADLRAFGNFALQYEGDLFNTRTGVVLASNLARSSTGNVYNEGTILGTEAVGLSFGALFNAESGLISSDDMSIAVSRVFENKGRVVSTGSVNLRAGEVLRNEGLIQAGRLVLNAPSIVTEGDSQIRGRDAVTLAAANGTIVTNGIVTSEGTLSVNTGAFTNKGWAASSRGLYVTANTLHNQGSITSGTYVRALVAKTIRNYGEMVSYKSMLLQAGQRVDNYANLIADTTLTINGPSFRNIGADSFVQAKLGNIMTANISNAGRVFLVDRFSRWGNIDSFTNAGLFASQSFIQIAGRNSASKLDLKAGSVLLSGLRAGDETQTLASGAYTNLKFQTLLLNGDIQAGGHVYLNTPGTLTVAGEVSAGQNLRTWSTNVTVDKGAALRAQGYGYLTTNGAVTNSGTLAFGGYFYTRGGTKSLTNEGVIYANRTSLEGMSGDFVNTGIIQTAQGISLTAQNITNDGLLQSGSYLSLYARRNVGKLSNGSVNYRLGTLTSNGTLTAANTLTMVGGSVATGAQGYISAARMNVSAAQFVNRSNAVIDGSVTNYWTTSGNIYNYGNVYLAASAVLRSSATVVDAKAMLASGNHLYMQSRGNAYLNGTLAAKNITVIAANASFGSASNAVANNDLRVTATNGYVYTYGELAAGDDLVVNSQKFDLRGNLYGEKVTLVGQTAGVTRGKIYSSTFANIRVANGRYSNLGTVQARTKLDVRANQIYNYANANIAATDVELTSSTWVLNRGAVLGAKSALLSAGTTVNNDTGGKVEGVSVAVRAEDFTNRGSIDVYGLYGTVNDLTYNAGTIRTKVYAGIETGRLENVKGGSIRSDEHLYLKTTGQANNRAGASIRGNTVDMRGGQFYNYGALRAIDTLNISDTAKGIYNIAGGTIDGAEIYLSANTWFNNSGRLGSSATKAVSVEAGTTFSNPGKIYGQGISLKAGTNLYNNGYIRSTGTAYLEAEGSLVQQGDIRVRNLYLIAGATIYNDGYAAATHEAVVQAAGIQNRIIGGKRGYIRAAELVLDASSYITNKGILYGSTALALRTGTGNIYSGATGSLWGPKTSLVSDAGWISVHHNTWAANEIIVEGRGITLTGYLRARNLVSLKSKVSDINVHADVSSKKVLVDAKRYIKANASSFRGTELTQLVANDIYRLNAAQLSPRTYVASSIRSVSSASYGAKESISGDARQYIASYDGLMRAYGWNSNWGAYHYNRWGKNEGRQITFDGLAYIASYGDLIRAYGTNAEYGAYHYIRWGKNEKRQIRFDAEQYLRNYADLRRAYGNDLKAATLHYIKWGYKEGRRYSPIKGALSLASWNKYVASKPKPSASQSLNWQGAQKITTTTSTTYRTEFRTSDAKLEVVGGAIKDLYIELRTGSFGVHGTDSQAALVTKKVSTSRYMANKSFMHKNLVKAINADSSYTTTVSGAGTRWNTYERANINASGNVSLIARAGDMMLTGSIKAAGNVYLYAGDRTGLRNIKLQAADTLHIEGRGNVLRYGGVTLAPGKALEVSTNASMRTSTWLTSTNLGYDATLFARDLTVDRSYRAANNTITFLASRNLVQRNEVVTAKKIDYQAGIDMIIDFDPFEWRAENKSSLKGGTGWDVRALGRGGYTLVTGKGGLSLYAGRDVKLTSGKMYSSRNIDITAIRNILSEPVYKTNTRTNRPGAVGWAFSSGYRGVMSGHTASKVSISELRAYENQIRAAHDITLVAGSSVNLIGSQLISYHGDVTVRALNGGVTMIAAPGQWVYDYTSVRTWRSGWFKVKKNRETTEVDALKDLYKPTNISAVKGDIVIESTGTNGQYASILTAGTKFNAKNITLATPNGNITAGTYRQRNEYKKKVHRTSKLFGFIPWGSSSSTSISHQLINYGNNFSADTLLSLSAPKGTISITGGKLKAKRIRIEAARLEINAAINTDRREYNSRRDNMITITTITSGRIKETADLPQITSTLPIEFNISGEAHISAARGTDLNSQLINVIGTRQFSNATLGLADPDDQQNANQEGGEIDRTFLFEYDLPGASDGAQYAYLDTLITDFGATYHTFDLRDQTWYDKQVQLNPAFKALLTAVVTYATGGLGLGASGTLTAGAIQAATNSVLVGVIEGTITGEMDMGAILRGALLAGVTSAISGYLTENINLGGYEDAMPDINNLDDLITPAAIVDRLGDRVISSVVSNVVHGQDPFEGLNSLGHSFLVSEIMAIAQFGIGELGEGNANWEGSAPHILLHGGVGCLAMVTMQGDCTAGFFSGAGQALFAGTAHDMTDEQVENLRSLMPVIGSLIGFVFSDGNATNVTFGGTVAQSGFENNYLTHRQIEDLQAEMASCSSSSPDFMACRDNIFEKYAGLSQINRSAMEACTTVTCWRLHADRMTAAQPARLALYESAYGANGLNPLAIQINQFVYEEQTQSGFALLVQPGGLELMAEWGVENCNGVIDLSCRTAFVRDSNAQAGLALLSLGLDFTPGIGDAKGVIECAQEMSASACLGAVAGFVPLLGDGVRILLRRGDDIVEVAADGAGGLRTFGDGSNLTPSSGLCSFEGGTLVLTREGLLPIRDLNTNMSVWSRNTENGEMDWKPVQAQYSNAYDETVSVKIRGVKSGIDQTIISNRIHPFFVQTKRVVVKSSEGHVYKGALEDGHWIDAANLKPGDRLLNAEAGNSVVVSVEIKKSRLQAFNLTVQDFHTYFVAANKNAAPVWVHNSCVDGTTRLPNGNVIDVQMSDERLDHVLRGQNGPNGPTGGHSTNSGNVELVGDVAIGHGGVRRGTVEINGQVKSNNNGVSTLFPEGWSDQRIVTEFSAGLRTGVTSRAPGGNPRVVTPGGVIVEFVTNNGNIVTFYPVF